MWAILVVDKLNTCCDALLSLFCNDYLRHGFKNVVCYVMLCNGFLDHQNQWGGLTKSDITFDSFEIFLRNLVVKRIYELPLGLYSLILKFLFLAKILAKNRRGSFFFGPPCTCKY